MFSGKDLNSICYIYESLFAGSEITLEGHMNTDGVEIFKRTVS